MKSGVSIHYGNCHKIGDSWDGYTFYGTCWRLVYAFSPGAEIISRHETVALIPDHIYLFPPRLSFRGRQQDDPELFYLHFNAQAPYDRVASRIYDIPLTGDLNRMLRKAVKPMREEPRPNDPSGSMSALALVTSAMAEIPPEYIQLEPMDPRVEEAVGFMRNHLNDATRVEEVAEWVGMGKGSFTKLFKQETGLTPYHYLMDLRIAWACDLLTQSTVPVEEIADRTGFTDRFHFSKVFKKWIGVPPVAYRRQVSE